MRLFADESAQPDAAAWSLPPPPRVRADAACRPTSEASTAAASAASPTFVLMSAPPFRSCACLWQPRRGRGPSGQRGRYAEVTKRLQERRRSQPAWPSGAEELARLGLHEAHAVVHQLERRLRCAPRLVGADGEQPLQLALVGTQGLVALPNRGEQLDDRLSHGDLEVAVAGSVEAVLE